jgi:hypothetical protein
MAMQNGDTAVTQSKDLPVRVPGRAARIAALHMAADWFAAHPDAAMPQSVEIRHHVHVGDQSERVAAVKAFAGVHGTVVVEAGGSVWSTYTLAATSVHGVDITYTVQTHLDRQGEGWDR